MNPEDRKVMEMAREALKEADALCRYAAYLADQAAQPGSTGDKISKALSLIDERLRADEKKPAEDVLWVYEWDTYLGVHRWLTSAPYNEREPDRRVAYVPQADEREEPVAYVKYQVGADPIFVPVIAGRSRIDGNISGWAPLYAHGRSGIANTVKK